MPVYARAVDTSTSSSLINNYWTDDTAATLWTDTTETQYVFLGDGTWYSTARTIYVPVPRPSLWRPAVARPVYPDPEAVIQFTGRGHDLAQATGRAKALLESMLDPTQREQMAQHQWFEVIARGSRRRYRLHTTTKNRNIEQVDGAGRHIRWLCAHPDDAHLPVEDHVLMQRLLLEHQEEEVLRVANIS